MVDQRSDRFRNLDDFAGIGSDWFWETDADHRFTYFSARMSDVTRLDSDAFLGRRRIDLADCDPSDPKWQAHLDDLANHRPFQRFEYCVHRRDGLPPLWLRVAGQPVFDAEGQFLGYRGVGHDITYEKATADWLKASNAFLKTRNDELAEARKALEQRAHEDTLTGAMNRRAFERDIAAALENPSGCIALLHVDLDRFKWVNDTLGHPAGDAVLIETADRLRRIAGTEGAIYRVGGDEFLIVLHGKGEDEITEIAQWIGDAVIEAMHPPVQYQGHQVSVSASVGIAMQPKTPTSAHDLVAHADAALYQSKRNGRSMVSTLTEAKRQEHRTQRRLATELRGALAGGQLIAHFQPQVDARTGQIVGAEALVRWNHPELGLLRPGVFFRPAEALGLVAEIDRVVLQCAMQFVDGLSRQNLTLPSMSVNVSAARLINPHLIKDVRKLWRNRQCKLSFELLETIYFDEISETTALFRNLDELRTLGVRIETDDFGSGRASITGLLKVRPDRIKIDRRLVQAAAHEPDKRSVVAAIVEMAHALGIDIMAEGVETAQDIAVIRALGCEVFQGFWYAKPMAADAFYSLLQNGGFETETAGQAGLPHRQSHQIS